VTLSFRLLAADRELAGLAERLGGAPELALDTEFVFERTFWPRPGLVQLAGAGELALVDALAIRDFAPLRALLVAPGTRKLVHAGGGDALVLERLAGARPAPVLDTQIAAAFCGLGPSLSYAALVEAVAGRKLGKHETRTDWTRRPLSPEQLRYAAEDVADLPAVAAALEARLAELGRLAWALEESAAALAADPERERPENAGRRLRGLDRLPPGACAVARELARWREEEARARDLPRGFVLADATLLALARRGALAPPDAPRLPGFQPRRHARFVEAWRAALAAAVAAAATHPPEPAPRRSAAERERLDRALAARVGAVARDLGLAPDLLLSRREREALLAGWDGEAPLASRLTGFRRALLGTACDGIA
jgi:ribonuclease D